MFCSWPLTFSSESKWNKMTSKLPPFRLPPLINLCLGSSFRSLELNPQTCKKFVNFTALGATTLSVLKHSQICWLQERRTQLLTAKSVRWNSNSSLSIVYKCSSRINLWRLSRKTSKKGRRLLRSGKAAMCVSRMEWSWKRLTFLLKKRKRKRSQILRATIWCEFFCTPPMVYVANSSTELHPQISIENRASKIWSKSIWRQFVGTITTLMLLWKSLKFLCNSQEKQSLRPNLIIRRLKKLTKPKLSSEWSTVG